MTIYGYADAEQPTDFNMNISSQNLMIYESIEEFNQKEGGFLLPNPKERLLNVSPKLKEMTDDEMVILAARGGSFDFLNDAGEDIYTELDGFPLE
jgi:hypothetical protein